MLRILGVIITVLVVAAVLVLLWVFVLAVMSPPSGGTFTFGLARVAWGISAG